MFDDLAERICCECVNGEECCGALDYRTCPFWGEFEELKKLCETADELAKNIERSAREDYWGSCKEFYECDNRYKEAVAW